MSLFTEAMSQLARRTRSLEAQVVFLHTVCAIQSVLLVYLLVGGRLQ